MGSLYETINELCESKGITGYRLCKDIGLTPGALTDLKMGRKQNLSAKNMDKVASYFGVSVSYLLGSEEQKNVPPVLTEKGKRDIAKELESFVAELEGEENIMFDGDPMTPEAKESIVAAMKLGLEAAKLKNKERFTPKKYRK